METNWTILKYFSSTYKECFSFQNVLDAYPNMEDTYLSKVLSKMIVTGMLIKLQHDLYHIVPLSANAKNYIPDWHLVAKYIMQGKPYYIGYHSAMQVHGLNSQPNLKEIIVIKHSVSSLYKTIQGVEFQFASHPYSTFFGFEDTWINQYNKVMVSNLEKTIVDALTQPQFCGGIVEVAEAIYQSRKKIDQDKLFRYLTQNDNKAAIKRYLFVCHLFDHWSTQHEEYLSQVRSNFSLLDPSGLNQGDIDSRFALRVNFDIETLKSSILY